jgi:hypothetical protein
MKKTYDANFMDFNKHSTFSLILSATKIAAGKISAQHMESKLQSKKSRDRQKDLIRVIEENKFMEL